MTVREVRGLGRRPGYTIRDAARPGKIGDGKPFTFDIDRAIRIRTGEAGENAL